MEWLEPAADIAEGVLEAIMVIVLFIGTIRALSAVLKHVVKRETLAKDVRTIWMHYAGWIVLALEFALAADIIGTIVEPSWQEIGQLAAIAAIRTALAWFLSKDIEEFSAESEGEGEEVKA